MAGNISEHPLAELIREAGISKLSGALRLEQERAKAVVYFEDGRPVFAASNLRQLRLGEYLKTHNLVSEQQLASLGQKRSDGDLAQALLSKGILDHLSVESVLAALAGEILSQALLWKEGTWEYDDRTLPADSFTLKLDTPSILIKAARKIDPRFALARFENQEQIISPSSADLQHAYLMPAEGFVLSRVDRPMRLGDVIMLSGLSEAVALQTVYGLVLAGYLQCDAFPQVLHKSATPKKPVAPPPPPKPVVVEPEIVPGLTEEQELQQFFSRMDEAANHYDVLDISRAAGIEEVKRAYYGLARRYHPDRFHAHADVHSRIESAFARVTQAYETLSHTKHKSTYDLKLATQEKARQIGEAAPKRKETAGETKGQDAKTDKSSHNAEKNFRDGYAALTMGQAGVAITQLAAASKAMPQEPRYRAYYGQALARDGRSQKLAEAEMQAAVKLDPKNATYRLMLAELFYDLAFHKRARNEVDRVLEIDPGNTQARDLLKKLQAVAP